MSYDEFGNREYCTNMKRRSPVLCKGELHQTRKFADRLQMLRPIEKLKLVDLRIRKCEIEACKEMRTESTPRATRNEPLHMVANPPVQIDVEDSYCRVCKL